MSSTVSIASGLLAGLRFTLLALVIFGGAYPFVTVSVNQALFPQRAGGSLIQRDGVVVGSEPVGQAFVGEQYLIGRPSAVGYDPMSVGGSNQAPSHPVLAERIMATRLAVAEREGLAPGELPADLVSASGSGIDPHLSPASAALQVTRIARARGIDPEAVGAIIEEHTEAPTLGVFGQPRVHVLRVNLELDSLSTP